MEGRGAQRLIGLSDGVVAIAATLLVVPLVQLVPDNDVDDIERVLRDARPNFVAFLLSFVVIYRFWLSHHRIFQSVDVVDGPLVWTNGLWLVSVVFLPFPTQLIGTQDSQDRVSFALYIGTMLVATASATVSQWLILRSVPPRARRGELRRSVILTVGMAVALLLALAVPGVGLWSLLILVPTHLITRRLDPRPDAARPDDSRP